MGACPQTYMNNSGTAVAALCAAHGVYKGDQVVVIHDELDLPPGRVKIKLGGNEAGHNGLRSVSRCLGTQSFVRVRVGVGKPPKGAGKSWVLCQPEEDIAAVLTASVSHAADAVQMLLECGLD